MVSFLKGLLKGILLVSLTCSAIAKAEKVSYTPETKSFPNPDRGWYSYAPILGSSNYETIGNAGTRLVYGAITLKDFVHRDINSSTLEKIQLRFEELRQNGVKAILRVNYNEETTGTDASKVQMIRHMRQLQPLLSENRDVIAYIEAGYFGQWGEWHDWCGGAINSNLTDDYCSKHLDNVDTWKWLVEALLKHTPEDSYILLRYPGKKQAIFGKSPVTAFDWYSGHKNARIGHHNDCFLSNPDDMGTYQTFDIYSTLPDLKKYLSEDTVYMPIGGETCYSQKGHRFSCANALPEMEQLHWTYLNKEYYRGALRIWSNEGCITEIDHRLGYRLELLDAKLPDSLVKGSTQTASFKIRNVGFSRVHHYRDAYLRLLQGQTILADMKLHGLDIRKVASGETESLTGTFKVPGNIPENTVSVALWLPDNDARNWQNSRFSIRLAYQQNEEDWLLITSPGHNVLTHNVPLISTDFGN